jgi:lipoyl(octanoyl) transferase
MPLARPSTSDPERTGASGVASPEAAGDGMPPLRVVRLPGLRPYRETWDLQRAILDARVRGDCPDTLLLLEHSPVVTVGRNAGGASLTAPEALLAERGIDLVATDRGGDATYHGPGQLVGYAIVDIKLLHNDIHRFLREIEEGIIRTVARWGMRGERVTGRTGVWVGGEKLASIGLKASHWVTMHGLALNVSGDLRGFDLIVPCGIAGCKMTSMERLAGHSIELQAVGDVLAGELAVLWGRAVVEEGALPWAI